MGPKNLLSGISLDDIDVDETLEHVAKVLKKEGPAAHKAFHSVEGDVEKAGKLLYDAFAGDDEDDENPDPIAKFFNG